MSKSKEDMRKQLYRVTESKGCVGASSCCKCQLYTCRGGTSSDDTFKGGQRYIVGVGRNYSGLKDHISKDEGTTDSREYQYSLFEVENNFKIRLRDHDDNLSWLSDAY